MNTKKPWESKTILLNAILGILAALAAFFPAANVVTSFINAHMAQIGMVWGIVGMILRTITKDEIVLID